MNATSIYNEIQSSLKKGERIAIATVVKTVGAATCGVVQSGVRSLFYLSESPVNRYTGLLIPSPAASLTQ